ncbi:histidinol-phosphate transaminase [Oceanicella sp. SM1341]|uniref:histidinol-phosphate transaminase n=1 Tax=Oceanicella sp. SM1341 TaxID=1548889 RepID=UPI000E4FECB2|nr:histidinol-phosphate transaminase [Oceanicella sp. SM1341]
MSTEHQSIRPQPGILEIAPYVGGESSLKGVNRVIKLSSNENPHGPSPRAIEAFRDAAASLALYPDGGHAGLRRAIAEVQGLDAERVICGAGSDEIIALLCQAYAGPGDEVIHTEHGFAMYRLCALSNGATPVEVPERARVTDVDAILAACNSRTKLVFLADPNNPTGTLAGRGEIARLAAGLPPQALLVIDGAYAEYVREPGYDSGLSLVEGRDNVVMTRTFSKIHGLAALRVGWGYGPAHVIDTLARVRGPFNVSLPGLAAAEAAMRDVEYTTHCAVQNEVWRDWLAKELGRHGVPSDPAHGNFILARFDSPETALACDEALRKRGLIVRRVAGYGLPACLRITVGDEEACRLVAEGVAAFMAGRGA